MKARATLACLVGPSVACVLVLSAPGACTPPAARAAPTTPSDVSAPSADGAGEGEDASGPRPCVLHDLAWLEDDRLRFEIDPPRGFGAGIPLLCALAIAADDAGFAWFSDCEPVPATHAARSGFETRLFHERPEGAHECWPLVSMAPAGRLGVYDAARLRELAGPLGFDPAHPRPYREPGPTVDPYGVEATLLLEEQADDLREVDVRAITFVRAPEPSIWIASSTRALRLSTRGEVLERVDFDARMMEAIPLDVDGDGRPEFADRGGGWQPVSLHASDGHTLWTYPPPPLAGMSHGSADAMTWGDTDGDGRPEFAVTRNFHTRLDLLDADGVQLSTVEAPDSVLELELLDVDGDGRAEAIQSYRDPRQSHPEALIAVAHPGGELLRTLPDGPDFVLVEWPPASGRMTVLPRGTDTLALYDPRNGQPVATFADRVAALVRQEAYASVAFGASLDDVLVVAHDLDEASDRCVLRLLHETRGVLYETLLAEYGVPVLAALPPDVDGGPALLVGVGNALWSYRLR